MILLLLAVLNLQLIYLKQRLQVAKLPVPPVKQRFQMYYMHE